MGSETFPADGGALEITDFSRPDKPDPSGKLRWLDWRLCTIAEEASLSAAPKKGADSVTVDESNGDGDADSPPASPEKATSSGAAVAGMVSPDVLRDLRNSLKKTK